VRAGLYLTPTSSALTESSVRMSGDKLPVSALR
jgi:hypothetical protein